MNHNPYLPFGTRSVPIGMTEFAFDDDAPSPFELDDDCGSGMYETPRSMPPYRESPYRGAPYRGAPYRSSPYRGAPGTGRLSPSYRPRPERPLRLVHVGPCFMNGGSEQHLIALAKFLDPEWVRFERCLVTSRKHLDAELARRMPVPVTSADAEAIRRAARDCDVMLSWGLAMNDVLGPVRPKLGVFLAHGETAWTRDTLLQSRRAADHVIAVSQRVAERVCFDFPHTVVLNGIDAARLAITRSRDAVRARYGFSPGDFVVGSVSRLVPDKRVEWLIDAVAELPSSFKLLVAGWGGHRGTLLERANDRIPGRYAFAYADDYLGDLYAAMDAFALSSAHEGFGLVVAEALTCGVPVVASPVGCVPEVVRDRVNGLVVSGGPASFAAAFRSLHEHPAWARGLAEEGRRVAHERLQAARMAREYEELLHRLWQTRAQKPAQSAEAQA